MCELFNVTHILLPNMAPMTPIIKKNIANIAALLPNQQNSIISLNKNAGGKYLFQTLIDVLKLIHIGVKDCILNMKHHKENSTLQQEKEKTDKIKELKKHNDQLYKENQELLARCLQMKTQSDKLIFDHQVALNEYSLVLNQKDIEIEKMNDIIIKFNLNNNNNNKDDKDWEKDWEY